MIISVWNCRAMVGRRVDLPEGAWTYESADNWEELESDAIHAVEVLGGMVNMSGIYHCPLALFDCALFVPRNPLLTRLVTCQRLGMREGEELSWVSEGAEDAVAVALLPAWKRLKPQERAVLEARFGECLTLGQVADRASLTRERIRQIEAKALRKLRHPGLVDVGVLEGATQVTTVPDGPLDPNWLSLKQARCHTALSEAHLRHLARAGRVVSRMLQGRVQLRKDSLRHYVMVPAVRGRKKRVWHDS